MAGLLKLNTMLGSPEQVVIDQSRTEQTKVFGEEQGLLDWQRLNNLYR